jgi:hypothetical protein
MSSDWISDQLKKNPYILKRTIQDTFHPILLSNVSFTSEKEFQYILSIDPHVKWAFVVMIVS